MQQVITCTDSHVTLRNLRLGAPRPRRPLAFVQPCPIGVTPQLQTNGIQFQARKIIPQFLKEQIRLLRIFAIA